MRIGDSEFKDSLDHELVLGSGIRAFKPELPEPPDEFAPFYRLKHASVLEGLDACPERRAKSHRFSI